jgi:hypothetical protein
MKYHIFNTEQEALTAEAQVAADIGCMGLSSI